MFQILQKFALKEAAFSANSYYHILLQNPKFTDANSQVRYVVTWWWKEITTHIVGVASGGKIFLQIFVNMINWFKNTHR
jgi:hypothetical protein